MSPKRDLALPAWDDARRRLRAVCLALTLSANLALGAEPTEFDSLSKEVARLSQIARFDEALSLATQYADKARAAKGEMSVENARAVSWQAYLTQRLGRIAEAEPLFVRALDIYERVLPAGHPDIATSINNLGFQYQITDRLDEAERLYKRALEMREKSKPPVPAAVADSLNNVAQVYKRQGRISEAEPLLRRSLEMRTKILPPNDPLIAQSQANLGALLELQNRYRDAEPHIRQALKIRTLSQSKDHPDVAGATSKLAQNLFKQGRLGEADKIFAEALAMRYRSQPPDHTDIANTLHDSAQNLVLMHRYPEARAALVKAIDIRRKALPASHPSIAHALADLAQTDLGEGKLQDALAHIREGVEIILKRAKVDDFGKKLFVSFVNIAWQVRSHEPVAEPIKLDDEAFGMAQRAAQTQTSTVFFRMSARFAAGNPELARLMRERDEAEDRMALNEQSLSAVLALPMEQRGGAADDIRAELVRLGDRIAAIDADLKSRFPGYFNLVRPDPLSIDAVRARLKPDEALLNYLVAEDDVYLWTVTRDGATWNRLDLSPEALTDRVSTLRRALDFEELTRQGGKAELFDLGLAHDLDDKLVGPARGLLDGKSQLIVVPSGPLTSLPFSLLVRSKPAVAKPKLAELAAYRDADWLVRHEAVSVLPSVASLRVARDASPDATQRKPLIGFGNPVFANPQSAAPVAAGSRGAERTAAMPVATTRGYSAFWRGPAADLDALRHSLPSLPETEGELRTVARDLAASDDDVLVGQRATEASVKKARLPDYRVVYFATHGLVAGEVSGLGEPALAFSVPDKPSDEDDGLLTASEVAQLEMNADWVILSACNTAAGDKPGAEALSGLARSFFHAGARALLVSHWRVGSEAAARLTTSTFKLLHDDPAIGRAEALRRAMAAMAADATDPWNAYPAFWAPFALIGDGGR